MAFCCFCVILCKITFKPAVHVTKCSSFVCTGCFGLIYHKCREGNPVNQQFTIDECPSGQVIDVESAMIGFSPVRIPAVKKNVPSF